MVMFARSVANLDIFAVAICLNSLRPNVNIVKMPMQKPFAAFHLLVMAMFAACVTVREIFSRRNVCDRELDL